MEKCFVYLRVVLNVRECKLMVWLCQHHLLELNVNLLNIFRLPGKHYFSLVAILITALLSVVNIVLICGSIE